MTILSKVNQILNTPIEGIAKSALNKNEGTKGIVQRKSKKIRFEIPAPDAKRVVLVGDFNSWDPKGIPMRKDLGGLWAIEVSLTSGRYEYKFIVDDQWRIDPSNSQTLTNSFGTQNSVKQVTV